MSRLIASVQGQGASQPLGRAYLAKPDEKAGTYTARRIQASSSRVDAPSSNSVIDCAVLPHLSNVKVCFYLMIEILSTLL